MKYILVFLYSLVSASTFSQVTKDSLYGVFVGTWISTENGDTTINKIVQLEIKHHNSECLANSWVIELEVPGVYKISTFDLNICDREEFVVNKENHLSSGIPGKIFFFGVDSVLLLSSGSGGNGTYSNQFSGIRDPNFQSISPPLNKEDLKVFPNPTNNQVTIQFPEPGTLKVFNILGQVQVQLLFSGEQQLNVEHWSEGVYIVELEVEGAKIRQPVVVQ